MRVFPNAWVAPIVMRYFLVEQARNPILAILVVAIRKTLPNMHCVLVSNGASRGGLSLNASLTAVLYHPSMLLLSVVAYRAFFGLILTCLDRSLILLVAWRIDTTKGYTRNWCGSKLRSAKESRSVRHTLTPNQPGAQGLPPPNTHLLSAPTCPVNSFKDESKIFRTPMASDSKSPQKFLFASLLTFQEPLEIFDKICSYLNMAEFQSLRQVCKRCYHVENLQRRFNINRLLCPFVSDVQRFRSELGKHDALISGGFALSFFDLGWSNVPVLDIFVEAGGQTDGLVAYIKNSEGYDKEDYLENTMVTNLLYWTAKRICSSLNLYRVKKHGSSSAVASGQARQFGLR